MPHYAAVAQQQQLGLMVDVGDSEQSAAAGSVLDGPLYPEVQAELQVRVVACCLAP
jgi:hypothetical protein